MRIATWNVNSVKARLPHLQRWLEVTSPDIVALQETKIDDANFPFDAITALGYECVYSGQKSYNGVALLSRAPASDLLGEIVDFEDPQRRVLAATYGDLRVVNLYVVNGQSVGSDRYRHKLDWLAAVTEWLRCEHMQYPKLVVLGDFNIAPDDRDVHDPLARQGSIHCSAAERDAVRAMLAIGLHDAFRLFHDGGGHYSWWDYRIGSFRRDLGMRIDLILVSDVLRELCYGCAIDREPRSWPRPSDHAPVVLELAT